MAVTEPFRGILPAMQVPYNDDLSVDVEELTRFSKWLAGYKGIGGLVTNGHTGEVFALSPEERAHVTKTTVDAVEGKVRVVSGVCAEGINEASEHAAMAAEAGASGLLVMPPHYWLRFGMEPEHVIEHFTAVGKASDINLIVHIYPSWCKAAYASELLAELAKLPWVTTFKVGTREMSKYDQDLRAIKNSGENVTALTCHDEYLLTSMVQGVDGALVGFASFIPELITALYAAVCDGDLKEAQRIQSQINGLKEVVYASGEPTGDAHARMKTAMHHAGRFKSTTVRPPTRKPSGDALQRIKDAVDASGLIQSQAAE